MNKFKFPDTGQVNCYDRQGQICYPSATDSLSGENGFHLRHPMSFVKLDAKGNDAQRRPDNHHRVQPDQPPLKEILHRHPFPPTVVIGIPYHKPRKDKEKIHSHITVIHLLVNRTGGKSLKHMKPHDHQGCNAPQPVQQFIMRLAIRKRRGKILLHNNYFLYFNLLIQPAKLQNPPH